MKKMNLVLALAMLFGAAACDNDGPLEEAGESIDDGVEEVADDVEDAVDN